MLGCEGLAANGLPGTGVVSTLSSLHSALKPVSNTRSPSAAYNEVQQEMP